MPGGRPSKYKPEYCKEVLEFFDVEYTREIEVSHTNRKGETWTESKIIANPPPQFGQFAKKLNISRFTLYEWAKHYKEFSTALSRAKEMAEEMTVSNAVMGYYNPTFTQLVMKNCFGWKDKQDLEHSGRVEGVILLPQKKAAGEA